MNINIKGIYLLIIFVVLQIVSGCGERSDKRMDYAESIIEIRPDSALYLLEKIDLESAAPESVKARYGLLLTYARYKNFIDEKNDSLISASADYYLAEEKWKEACLALQLKGFIGMNAGKYSESALAFMQGLELARKEKEYKVEGFCAKWLGNLYILFFDGDQQIRYLTESKEAFRKGGYSELEQFARLDLANAYYNTRQYNKALEEAVRLREETDEEKVSDLAAEIMRLIGQCQFELNRKDESLKSYLAAFSLDSTVLNVNDRGNILVAMSEEKIDSLPVSLKFFNRDALVDVDEGAEPFELLAQRGDYKAAYAGLERYKVKQDSVLLSLLSDNISGSLINYEKNRNEVERKERKFERLLWSVVIAGVILVIAGILFILRRRMAAHRREYELLFEEANYLKEDLSEQIRLNEDKDISIMELLKLRYEIMNNFCSSYYEFKGRPTEKTKIIREFEETVGKFRKGNVCMNEIGDQVDKYTGGLFTMFKKDYPDFKESDRSLFLYLIMGFSARSISIFIDEKIEVVYNRKSRLKNKIRESNSGNKEKYLHYLG